MGKPIGSNKTGGRVKGTPNKRTKDFSEYLDKLDIDLLKMIFLELPKVNGKEKIDVLLKLLPYKYSKKKEIEIQSPPEKSVHAELKALIEERKTQ